MGFYRGPNIVTNGLVLALDAANSKSYQSGSTTWYDKSGNNNNGTLTNGPTFSTSGSGAIVFDGVDDYVNLETAIQNYTVFTTSFWINYNVFTDTHRSPIGDNSQQFFYHVLFLGGLIYLGFSSLFTGNGYTSGRSHGTITAGIWYNITITKDGSNNIIFYKNGVSLGGENKSGGVNINSLGRGYVYDNTKISNILFYNRALSPEEILQNFNATKGRFNL